MRKKLLSILLVTALASTLLAGCSGAASGASASESTGSDGFVTYKACFATGMTGAVNRFAIEKGLYEAEGIKFDVTDWESNDLTLSLISRGDIEIADGDPSTYIPAIKNGVPAKLVGNMWRYQGCFWLLANNDIQSFEDLKGKTIGTAGPSGGMKLSVLKMLEVNGISEDEIRKVY